jgi:hypothetical protein
LALVVLGVVVLHGHGAVAARPLLRGIAEPPSSAAAGPGAAAQLGGGGRRHDRSEAGAEVILAGFAAAVMVVIFCYIRVTRKSNAGGRAGPGGKPPESLGGF